MSVHFTLRCLLCDVDGPDVRLSNGVSWVDKRAGRLEDGAEFAHEWLREHEYHGGARDEDDMLVDGGLILVHE